MSDLKGVFKSGWHPKGKDGGKESWRGDFKGINQVAGWVGKGKSPNSGSEGSSHVSRPLATLKDPAAFGPPPKNVNYHGGAALPNEITPHTGGIGAPLTQTQIASAQESHYQHNAEEYEQPEVKAGPPPLPYRADRTGLATSNLPAPPVRRDKISQRTQPAARPTPSLPPRLPSRQNTVTTPIESVSPPPYEAAPQTRSPIPTPTLNQSAMNRLGNAGVSVPSLGIGRTNSNDTSGLTGKNPWSNEKSQNTSNQMSELQSRFKRFNTNSTTSTQDNSDNSTATTTSSFGQQQQQQPPPALPSWKQTQTSLRTASNFHKDPSSVTLADAQQAANTAQSAHANATALQAKHADKFDAAERKATAFNKRYNVTNRLNKFLEDANDDTDPKNQNQNQNPNQQQLQPQTQNQDHLVQGQQQPQPVQSPVSSPAAVSIQPPTPENQLTASIARKPPPPPPPKKPGNLSSAVVAPPPVPLGTKPR